MKSILPKSRIVKPKTLRRGQALTKCPLLTTSYGKVAPFQHTYPFDIACLTKKQALTLFRYLALEKGRTRYPEKRHTSEDKYTLPPKSLFNTGLLKSHIKSIFGVCEHQQDKNSLLGAHKSEEGTIVQLVRLIIKTRSINFVLQRGLRNE